MIFPEARVIFGVTSGSTCNTSVASLGLKGVLHTGCCLQEACRDLQQNTMLLVMGPGASQAAAGEQQLLPGARKVITPAVKSPEKSLTGKSSALGCETSSGPV